MVHIVRHAIHKRHSSSRRESLASVITAVQSKRLQKTDLESISKTCFYIKLKCTREGIERTVVELKYVSTKERMSTLVVTKFIEKVQSKYCKHNNSDFSENNVLMR